MEKQGRPEYLPDELPPAIPLPTLLVVLLAVVVGTIAATLVLPIWLPGMRASLQGEAPRAYWYLARSSGFVAYVLLWLAMVFGLLITNKFAQLWPGGLVAFDLHQYTSLLGLAFALFHALILLGTTHYTPLTLLVPFASVNHAAVWVGLGQLGLYLMASVGLSFYARKQLGRQAWRRIHFLSFAVFLLALLHGIGSGTDSASAWATGLYWVSGASVLFLTIYRFVQSVSTRFASPAHAQPHERPR